MRIVRAWTMIRHKKREVYFLLFFLFYLFFFSLFRCFPLYNLLLYTIASLQSYLGFSKIISSPLDLSTFNDNLGLSWPCLLYTSLETSPPVTSGVGCNSQTVTWTVQVVGRTWLSVRTPVSRLLVGPCRRKYWLPQSWQGLLDLPGFTTWRWE